MLIIVDSNVIISALIKNSITRSIIFFSGHRFLLPEYSLLEIKEHEKEILAKSGLSKEEFILLMKNLMKYLLIVKTAKIEKYRDRAYKIMGWIDEDDVMFIACALSYPKSMIWSDDKHFKIQKEIKVYNTQEIMKILSR